VACFQAETLESLMQLTAAAGLSNPEAINRSHVYRRVALNRSERYDAIYPYIESGSLLKPDCPDEWIPLMSGLDSSHFN